MWLAANTMPRILPYVSDLPAKIPTGKLRLVNDANYLVHLTHDHAETGIRIARHAEGIEFYQWHAEGIAFYQWHNAAWGVRPNGLSQGGSLTCAGPPRAQDGELCECSVLDWGCKKPQRVAKSRLATEARAVTMAEGERLLLRLAHRELDSVKVQLDDFDTETKKRKPATMITEFYVFAKVSAKT